MRREIEVFPSGLTDFRTMAPSAVWPDSIPAKDDNVLWVGHPCSTFAIGTLDPVPRVGNTKHRLVQA
jgi:hypothetical protein